MSTKKESFKSFEELDCWKACRDVRQYVAKLVKKYPPEEKFRIVDDMLRAADLPLIILRRDLGVSTTRKMFNSAVIPEVLCMN